MSLKPGYKGRVKLGATVVGGATAWNYGGSTREMHEDTEFGDQHQTHIPGQIVGGEITINGNYLQFEDVGQQQLKSKFESGEPITDLCLYVDESSSIYMTLDDSTTPASYCTVINYDNVANDKAGVGTFTATLKVSGRMKPVY